MTENEAVEILKNNFPKTCKMVGGRYKGGFDDTECEFGQALLLSISALEEIRQYRAIGTVEECQEAREKQRGKKPNKRQLGNTLVRKIYHCPNCNKRLYDCAFKNGELDHVSPGSRKSKFCEDCGQKLDWGDTT